MVYITSAACLLNTAALQNQTINQMVTGTYRIGTTPNSNSYKLQSQELLAIQVYRDCYSWVQLHGLSKTFKNDEGLRLSQASCQRFILQGICIYNSCYLTQQILA